MEHSILQLQREKAEEIEKVLAKYRGTEAWNIAQKAFHQIMRNYIHGETTQVSDEELNQHFEQAIVTSQLDVHTYLNKTKAVVQTQRDTSSPYYMVNVAHTRNDQFFTTNQKCPVTGAGSETLNAKFTAQNLYQRTTVNATSVLPPRVANSPLPTWASMVAAMTDKPTFDATFDLVDPTQAAEVFAVTSAIDWNQAEADLFITPDLFGGAVFAPAMYSIYFMGANKNAFKNIYFFVSADGFGNPQKPFIGVIEEPISGPQMVYESLNRSAFSYLSSGANPVKYWMEVKDKNLLDYTLNIHSYFPDHMNAPYIEVVADFTAQVSPGEIAYFKDIPGISTIMMLHKGTLMRDLVKAYFPQSTSAQIWEDIGALTGKIEWINDLAAIGLDAMSDIFAANVWEEKPEVVPTA